MQLVLRLCHWCCKSWCILSIPLSTQECGTPSPNCVEFCQKATDRRSSSQKFTDFRVSCNERQHKGSLIFEEGEKKPQICAIIHMSCPVCAFERFSLEQGRKHEIWSGGKYLLPCHVSHHQEVWFRLRSQPVQERNVVFVVGGGGCTWGQFVIFPVLLPASIWGHCSQVLVFASIWESTLFDPPTRGGLAVALRFELNMGLGYFCLS